MSYPRIGYSREVHGDFTVKFEWNFVIKEDIQLIEIQPCINDFKIENEYFDYLFQSDKICLYWQIRSDKTFLNLELTGFNKVSFETHKVTDDISINYMFIASEDFEFDPPKSLVNDFFLGKRIIPKGAIVSDENRFEIIKLKVLEVQGSSSIIKIQVQQNLSTDYEINFSTDKHITLMVRSSDFATKFKMVKSKKNIRALVVNNFLAPIYIEAIRLLSNDEVLQWKEDLKELIDYNEEKAELYNDFVFAYQIYNSNLVSDKNFLAKSLFELENLLTNA